MLLLFISCGNNSWYIFFFVHPLMMCCLYSIVLFLKLSLCQLYRSYESQYIVSRLMAYRVVVIATSFVFFHWSLLLLLFLYASALSHRLIPFRFFFFRPTIRLIHLSNNCVKNCKPYGRAQISEFWAGKSELLLLACMREVSSTLLHMILFHITWICSDFLWLSCWWKDFNRRFSFLFGPLNTKL